ncbi:FadR/GntR family transcriptional regulator [Brucella haematophila]|uniref:FadR family transcriptional regulator n=1 Tax=Brucella haematophila TaxID=419474 RepID=A0ABX1DQ97_9HYPH|nr:FCD domain-containing protein [Brucella haematophila]NKC05121.1 FadR family transcriptional regulator [Brucella haematophila]TMU95481.1 FadR family transcriptional regulator [Brucella haematophila]
MVEIDPMKADKQSAVDQAIDQIRSLIREKGLTVGDVLPTENELASMFDTGRNTIREAVRTLKTYGIIESRQKAGIVITDRRRAAMHDFFSVSLEISTDMFTDIQGFRRLTEMNLAGLLVGKMSEADLQLMDSANRTMADASDAASASEYDFRFHQIMVDAAGNHTLSEIYGMLKPVVLRLMELGKSQRGALKEAAEEHDRILEALRSGEAIDFVYHMNRHLASGLQFLPND